MIQVGQRDGGECTHTHAGEVIGLPHRGVSLFHRVKCDNSSIAFCRHCVEWMFLLFSDRLLLLMA